MSRLLAAVLAVMATAVILHTPALAQPRAVDGTEMVPNEYGSEFPREIIWERDGSKMVLIPYGTFRMGRDQDAGGLRRESPEREVYVSSFYMDKYEITNEKYDEFRSQVRTAPPPRPTGHEDLLLPEHPAVGLPWAAANAYATWAGKQLPTEAQWEKAARGPDNTLYTTGRERPTREMVVAGGSVASPTVPARGETRDVSGYGVHHMGGNASEWTRDWFERDYYARAPREDPPGPSSGDAKTVRGGSFLSRLEETRTTFRQPLPPGQIRDQLGFRTVWVPRPVEERTPEPEVPATPTPRPTPSGEELIARFKEELLPYLRRGQARLPREMMASGAHVTRGHNTVQFVNFTPFRMSLNFVGLDDERVFKYDEPLPPMTFRNVELPQEINLHVLAWAPRSAREDMVNLGFVRAESNAIIVVPTEFFGPLMRSDGSRMPVAESTIARQYYDSFRPLWNQFEVHNAVDVSVMVKIEDVTGAPRNVREVGEYLVEPGVTLRLSLDPRRYRVSAEYLGALDESSRPVEFMLDDRAARRLLHIREDRTREETVTVITQERPFLAIEVFEARPVARPR